MRFKKPGFFEKPGFWWVITFGWQRIFLTDLTDGFLVGE